VRSILRRDEADHPDAAQLKWDRFLDCPSAQSAPKVTLFYQEEEIQSVQLIPHGTADGRRTKPVQLAWIGRTNASR